MKISEKKVVALTYTLTVDGQVADQTTEDRPLDFIFGMSSAWDISCPSSRRT